MNLLLEGHLSNQQTRSFESEITVLIKLLSPRLSTLSCSQDAGYFRNLHFF